MWHIVCCIIFIVLLILSIASVASQNANPASSKLTTTGVSPQAAVVGGLLARSLVEICKNACIESTKSQCSKWAYYVFYCCSIYTNYFLLYTMILQTLLLTNLPSAFLYVRVIREGISWTYNSIGEGIS